MNKINLSQKWLPTPGSILFTLLIAALLYAHQARAFPASNANSPTQTSSTTTLPYQGRLTDTNGNPVNTTQAMTFRLYNVASGGTALWQESWPAVQVSDGLFNVLLGSTAPITPTLFAENNSLWLGITVGTDTEMAPRMQVGSVPFAFQASRAFGLIAADGSPRDAVVADADGNVGIGTTSPSGILDVTTNGGSRPNLELTNSYNGLGDTPKTFYMDVSSNGCIGRKLTIGYSEGLDPNDYDVCVGASSIMVIDSNGNIGIGTINPTATLHVVGGNKENLPIEAGIELGTDTTDHTGIEITTDGGPSYIDFQNGLGEDYDARLWLAGDDDFRIEGSNLTVSGNICANNGSNCVLSPSDLRLKTNITLLIHPLDKLAQLRGVTFDWNDKALALGLSGDAPHIGVIAQEVEAVFPEMVTTMDNGYKAVDYSKLSAVLIEAVKELRAEKDSEIAVLQAEISDLKTQMTTGNPAEKQIPSSVTMLSGFWFFLGVFVGVGGVCMGFFIAKRQLLAVLTSPKTN